MKTTLLLPLLLAAFLCASPGAPAVKLADHPTSIRTAYPALHNARKFNGRVYFGYGDWNGYCATTLTSYDPAANTLNVEFSSASDSVEMMRVIDGTFYIPHCDPIHHEDFHDYSTLSADGRWRGHSQMEQLHVYDFAKTSHGLYCAANGLWRSLDGGATWTRLSTDTSRRYWCAALNDTVYTSFERVTATNRVSTSMTSLWNHAEVFRDTSLSADILVGLTGKTPGLAGIHTGLMLFNGTSTKTLGGRHFTIADGELHILGAGTISKTSNPWAAAPTFTAVNISGIPSNSSCLEYLNGKYYIGTNSGEIWIGNADGSTVTVVPPVVQAAHYDSFGRGLALWADSLLVGAPDASGSQFLEGRAEVWTRTGGLWQQTHSLTPPIPDFSSWHGKDVALHDDMMAVVEAGHDTLGSDRGGNAMVHVYQLTAGTWQLRSTLNIPFAHSLAFQPDMLVVGTSNQAANQASGRPGVIPVLLTRPGGILTTTQQPQTGPTSTLYGYKALARVALLDDLLIAGYSSDPSRTSTGMVSVYRRSGNTYLTTATQEFTSSTGTRFGFSVAADSGWVAVGAPFDDAAGKNCGAVSLYEKTTSTTAPLLFRQKLSAPVSQPEAEFGYSVAMQGNLLLVGCPGRDAAGNARRGAVYKYRRQADNTWAAVGEVPPPAAADSEYGIEVAANARWIGAGSLGSVAGASSLASRVQIIPRTPYYEWLDAMLHQGSGAPATDAEGDGLENLLEYVCNISPDSGVTPSAGTSAGGQPAGLPSLARLPDGQMAVTLVRPLTDPNLTFTLQSSPDLVTWTSVTYPEEVLISGTTHKLVKILLPAEWSDRFIRVKAEYSAP